ncbi:hypothetical protein NMYAN_50115 [Nitrosomonas nitrosa]|uniref:Uncharacterized protein n=1 Tax=Nitrosomonas nitrosa TaxID=52442 RepID=A0A8H8Z290_9PROT|nr:hypothetical protein NMYAN_50115 [Nitrosomonas nitrosa]
MINLPIIYKLNCDRLNTFVGSEQ